MDAVDRADAWDRPPLPLGWLAVLGVAGLAHLGAWLRMVLRGEGRFALENDRTTACIRAFELVHANWWLWLLALAAGLALTWLSRRRGYGLLTRSALFLPLTAAAAMYGLGMLYLAMKILDWSRVA